MCCHRKVFNETAFAAFVVHIDSAGCIAATTRPNGGVGLPGGKIEANETAGMAALREAREEGWFVLELQDYPIHTEFVNGKEVKWFLVKKAVVLPEYKEKGRIEPIRIPLEEFLEKSPRHHRNGWLQTKLNQIKEYCE